MNKQARGNSARQGGFSLTEMLVAASLFLVGVVAVAQLVPTTMQLNVNNRNGSSAITYAEREMAQLLEQPLSSALMVQPTSTFDIDSQQNPVWLGDPNQPGVLVGSPLLPVVNNVVAIDFSQPTVPGYSAVLVDPNDPSGTKYDMRWSVITSTQNNTPGAKVISKRFFVGVMRLGGTGFSGPVTLDAVAQQ